MRGDLPYAGLKRKIAQTLTAMLPALILRFFVLRMLQNGLCLIHANDGSLVSKLHLRMRMLVMNLLHLP